MSALSPTKRAIDEIRAAVVAQCDEALKSLSDHTVSPENIHSARKALKKARAWLRLLRMGIKPQAFREHNHLLRDAARPLSHGRDAEIRIETVHTLLKRFHEPARDRRFGRFERALQRDRREIQRQLLSSRTGVAASRRLLRRSKKALTRLPIKGNDWAVIGASFEKAYARGREDWQAARNDPAPELLHEWRKDTKNSGINCRC